MRSATLPAVLVVIFIAITGMLNMAFETFSYVIEAVSFQDTARHAAKVASTEVTQYAVRRTSSTTVDSYYQQKQDSANGSYGLAQIQDGFIVVDTDIFNENSRYAGAELPVGNRYIDYLRTNMETLVSRFGFNDDGDPRYDPKNNLLKIEYIDSVYGDKSKVETSTKSDAYEHGTASRQYKISMRYQPRLKATEFLLDFMGDIDLVAYVQPINYIEP